MSDGAATITLCSIDFGPPSGLSFGAWLECCNKWRLCSPIEAARGPTGPIGGGEIACRLVGANRAEQAAILIAQHGPLALLLLHSPTL